MYWHSSDYRIIWAYHDKAEIERKNKRDSDNHLAWLSGLYVKNAIDVSLNGGEYPKMIDFNEMDRLNSLSEEELVKEQNKSYAENSRNQMMRMQEQLKREKEGE